MKSVSGFCSSLFFSLTIFMHVFRKCFDIFRDAFAVEIATCRKFWETFLLQPRCSKSSFHKFSTTETKAKSNTFGPYWCYCTIQIEHEEGLGNRRSGPQGKEVRLFSSTLAICPLKPVFEVCSASATQD